MTSWNSSHLCPLTSGVKLNCTNFLSHSDFLDLLLLRPLCCLRTTLYLQKATMDCFAPARTNMSGVEQTQIEMPQMIRTETFFNFRWIFLYFRGISRLSSLSLVSKSAWRHVELLRMFFIIQTASSFHFGVIPNWLVRSVTGVMKLSYRKL